MFEREKKSCQRLEHIHIYTTYDYGEDNDNDDDDYYGKVKVFLFFSFYFLIPGLKLNLPVCIEKTLLFFILKRKN